MDNRSDRGDGHVFELAIRITRGVGMGMIVIGIAIAMGFGNVLRPGIGIFIAFLGLIEFFAIPAVLNRVINAKRDDFLAGKNSGHRE